jgi:hypothetical protein
LTIGRTLDLDANPVTEVALGLLQPLLEAFGGVGRIEPGRKRDDANVESLSGGQLHPAQRRFLPGGVCVEAEI